MRVYLNLVNFKIIFQDLTAREEIQKIQEMNHRIGVKGLKMKFKKINKISYQTDSIIKKVKIMMKVSYHILLWDII